MLPAGPVTFVWSKGTAVTKYDLQVSFDPNRAFFDLEDGPATKADIGPIPAGGSLVYVKLVSANVDSTALFQRWYAFGAPGAEPAEATFATVKVGAYGLTDTGVDLPAGARLGVYSHGGIFMNSATFRVSPAGDQGCEGVADSLKFEAPRLPCWGLIGRIDSGPYFFAGTAFESGDLPPGRLFLSVNDDNFTDNRGNWTTLVAIVTPGE